MLTWPPGGKQCRWEKSAATSCSAAALDPEATTEEPLPGGSTHPEAVPPIPDVLPANPMPVLPFRVALLDVDAPAAAAACCTRICRWLTALSRTSASASKFAAGDNGAAELRAAG
jgi:hypothetical protein